LNEALSRLQGRENFPRHDRRKPPIKL
jgi:hypothetical protein